MQLHYNWLKLNFIGFLWLFAYFPYPSLSLWLALSHFPFMMRLPVDHVHFNFIIVHISLIAFFFIPICRCNVLTETIAFKFISLQFIIFVKRKELAIWTIMSPKQQIISQHVEWNQAALKISSNEFKEQNWYKSSSKLHQKQPRRKRRKRRSNGKNPHKIHFLCFLNCHRFILCSATFNFVECWKVHSSMFLYFVKININCGKLIRKYDWFVLFRRHLSSLVRFIATFSPSNHEIIIPPNNKRPKRNAFLFMF